MEHKIMTTGGMEIFPILVVIAYFVFETVDQYQPARMRTVEVVVIERGQSVHFQCPKIALQVRTTYGDECTRLKSLSRPAARSKP
jgi:hypothetical protein